MYFFSGSSWSSKSIVFSYLVYVSACVSEARTEDAYMVNTIPPLSTSRANRGTAPDQNVRKPSSLNILAAQWKLFLYSCLASIDCILPLVSQPLEDMEKESSHH